MQRKYAYIWGVHVHSRLATASSGMSWQVFCESAGIICRPRWENHILDMTGGIFNDLQWEGPSGPHRNVSEVSVRETEAVKVPAERSGAACPTGAVTAGDWGWTDRISVRNPVINDKILVFNIILLNINSSNRCFK